MSDTLQPEIYRTKSDSALRGCLIGCLAFFGGALILAVLLFFVAYNFLSGVVDNFTSEAPREIPAVVMSQEEKDLLFGKADTFGRALTSDDLPLEPVSFTGDEINVLLREYPTPHDTYNWISVQIIDGIIRADVSVPLKEMGLGDRYLNGSGELEAQMENGELKVFINSLEVDGQPLPGQFLAGLRQYNLAQDVVADPKSKQMLDQIASIKVEGDQVIITPVP